MRSWSAGLLIVACILQVLALQLLARSDIAIETDGVFFIRHGQRSHERRKWWGNCLTVVSVVCATAAGLVAL
jgi:hypothetical protein